MYEGNSNFECLKAHRQQRILKLSQHKRQWVSCQLASDVSDDHLFSGNKCIYRKVFLTIFLLHSLAARKAFGYNLGQISTTKVIQKIWQSNSWVKFHLLITDAGTENTVLVQCWQWKTPVCWIMASKHWKHSQENSMQILFIVMVTVLLREWREGDSGGRLQ